MALKNVSRIEARKLLMAGRAFIQLLSTEMPTPETPTFFRGADRQLYMVKTGLLPVSIIPVSYSDYCNAIQHYTTFIVVPLQDLLYMNGFKPDPFMNSILVLQKDNPYDAPYVERVKLIENLYSQFFDNSVLRLHETEAFYSITRYLILRMKEKQMGTMNKTEITIDNVHLRYIGKTDYPGAVIAEMSKPNARRWVNIFKMVLDGTVPTKIASVNRISYGNVFDTTTRMLRNISRAFPDLEVSENHTSYLKDYVKVIRADELLRQKWLAALKQLETLIPVYI